MINKNHIFLHSQCNFIITISLPIPISGQSRVSLFSTSPLGPKNLPQDVKLSLSIAGPDTSDSWPLLRDPAAFSSIYPLLTGSSSFSCSCSSSRPLPDSHVFPVHGSHCPVKPYFRPLPQDFNELIAIRTHRVIHMSHF